MLSKSSIQALLLPACAALTIAGCGDGTPSAPVGAVRPPDPHPPISTKKVWTLQDKIDAVQNSGMSADQKKKTIEGLRAQGG